MTWGSPLRGAGSYWRLRSVKPGRQSDIQRMLQALIKFHDSSLVTAAVTVVGGREDGDDVPFLRPVESLNH